jgi:succinylglutamic semialdehyde dehydrogenase
VSAKSHFINGQWIEGAGPVLSCADPANDQVTWQGHGATDAEVDQAVAAARSACERWVDTPLPRRIEYVQAFGKQLTDHKKALAETISRDTGKPLWESLTEVGAMIGKIDLSINAYHERRGTVSRDLNGVQGVTRFKPYGVCAVFGPFNLPGHLPNGHIVPALIAGNTVVFKPSEQAAAVGQHMLELWQAVGLPEGVVNMVQGSRDTGVALSTGLALSRVYAQRPEKILALEMGGNNPLVVWDVADLDAAVYLTIQSAYITAGQRCTCARRLIVPVGSEGDNFIERLAAKIGCIHVGAYTDRPEPFMGPVISSQAAQKLLDGQHALCQNGGDSIVEMTMVGDCPAMLSPGLIDVTRVPQRDDVEMFGPLLQVIRVTDFDAAIQEANRTVYGLSAALFSDSQEHYGRFFRGVRAGVINWNRQTTGASGTLPFGGVGASGNHRPSGYYAADYCSYPVASMEQSALALPSQLSPGID